MKAFLFVLVAIFGSALAKQYCNDDTDCEYLGNLKCMFSMCGTWGVCGCERGYYARYLGSERNFDCVPARKVDEHCTTDWEEGYCAAEHSSCKLNICVCDAFHEKRWGGESCRPYQQEFFNSESCVDGAECGDGSTCTKGNNWWGAFTGLAVNEPLHALTNVPFDQTPGVCACPSGFRTALPNTYETSFFMGRKTPICVALKVGDKCTRDADCGNIKVPTTGGGGWTTFEAAVCDKTSAVCRCRDATHKADITGLFCGKPMAAGAPCTYNGAITDSENGVCNGDLGLRCGDPCDLTEWNGSQNFTCVCDPGWVKSGSSCSKAAEGTACVGDFQCKSFNDNAICEYGACANSAVTMAMSLATMLLPLVAFWSKRS